MSHLPFEALGVSAPIAGALAARNIHRPFPIQELVLPDALAGLDILAQSPTGSGKTLAFGVPMLDRIDRQRGDRPAALVLAPTRRGSGSSEPSGPRRPFATPGGSSRSSTSSRSSRSRRCSSASPTSCTRRAATVGPTSAVRRSEI